jgi:hypothetical protein
MGKFKFTRSRGINLDLRAIRGVTVQNAGPCRRTYTHECLSQFHQIIKMSHTCSLFYTYIHFWLLGSRDKATGLIRVAAQKGSERCLRRRMGWAVKTPVYCSTLCKARNRRTAPSCSKLVQPAYCKLSSWKHRFLSRAKRKKKMPRLMALRITRNVM